MEACDNFVLVLPCGHSVHTKAGWLAGKGMKVYSKETRVRTDV